jgi:hypothetical protein
MGETNHVVKTELKLEGSEHMHEALEHVKEGFESVDEKVHEVGGEIVGMFKNAAAVALGFQLEGAVESLKELGHEAFEAAEGMEKEEKAIRGVLAMIDQEGSSMEELAGQAHELNEQFTEMSESTGAAKADIVAAFDEMAERTGMGADAVKQLTEEMANAGKAVPGGIGALSEGFSNLSSGIIRARNPVVQMIAATGLLHGNAKQVAAQMMKMNPEQAMQLGIDAVEKMGNKMKGLPLTFSELVTSLKTVREEIFESLGAPILKALGGPLDRLRGYFTEHKEMIQHWAEVVGDKVGEWVGEAADKIQEGFEYLQDHADEIEAAFTKGAHAIRAVVDFILAHKEAIAGAFAAKALVGSAGGVMGALGKAGGMLGGGGGAAKAGEEAAEAAVVGAESEAALASSLVATGAVAGVLAVVALAAAGAVDDLADSTNAYHDEAVSSWSSINANVSGALDELTTSSDSVGGSLKEVADWMGVMLLDSLEGLTAFIKDDYIPAMTAVWHAMQMILAPVGKLLDMLGMHSGGGGASLVTHDSAPGMAHGGLVGVGGDKGEMGAIKAPPIYNFTGAITIQQDFKDTDPDRIATIFREDMGRAARSKVSASTQVPQSHF